MLLARPSRVRSHTLSYRATNLQDFTSMQRCTSFEQETQTRVCRTTSSKSKKKTTPWHIVWCHEHCHKAEQAEVRDKLQEAATSVGADLVVFKKSEKYKTWLTTQCCNPHMLITNWREAKPSLNAIEEHEIKTPSAIAVLVDKDDIFQRALSWARTCKGVYVSVFQESALDNLRALLASESKKIDQKQPLVVRKTATQASPQEPDKKLLSMPGPSVSQLKCRAPATTLKLEEVISAKPQSPRLVTVLMQALQDPRVAAKIHSDLLRSMPEVYED
eukprot:TRINITY_DN9818_c0_g1_i4.p1 TRINITY_DN9818_c0_g1~~TRINITY_DN9818_c0_g1_i4.p1  ORF type:complete len:274 (-),score=46.03 TRINITY_DN9818_c0_g1_i4:287-1108(-)